jgi:DsbC/DsbD-like thiol-disulfide interchange protein
MGHNAGMTALLPLLALATAVAQAPDEAPTVSLKFAKATAAPGEKVKATLTVTFAPGLHAYQNPPSEEFQIPIKVGVAEKGFKLVKATYPVGTDFTMGGETKPAKVYEGTIAIPLEIKASAKPANYNVNVRLDYQQCNASSCFPPSSVVVKAKLTVAAPKKVKKS